MNRKNICEICTLIMGQSPDSKSYNKDKNGIPFYQGNADFGEEHPTPTVWCTAPKKIARKGDILISVRAPIGDMNIANEDCCIGRGLAAIRLNKSDIVDINYLYHYLSATVEFLQEQGTGSTFKAINKTTLEGIEIPCPSIEKQKNIAKLIIEIKTSIQYKKAELFALNELVKSRFIEMFGTLDLSIQGETWLPLSDVSTIFTGTTPSTKDIENWNGDIPWVTPAELSDDSFVVCDTERKITQKGMKSKSLSLMPKNTVLLSTRAPIGKVAITGIEMCCNQGFKNFYCNNTVLNPIYLYTLLRNNSEYLNSLGTGTTFKEISKKNASNIKVPVADISLQNEFADFVKLIDKSKFIVQKQIDDLQELLDSKMDEYFG